MLNLEDTGLQSLHAMSSASVKTRIRVTLTEHEGEVISERPSQGTIAESMRMFPVNFRAVE